MNLLRFDGGGEIEMTDEINNDFSEYRSALDVFAGGDKDLEVQSILIDDDCSAKKHIYVAESIRRLLGYFPHIGGMTGEETT